VDREVTPADHPLSWFREPDAPARDRVLSCVHCGLCLSACPTYRVLGTEPDSPRGRIYLIRALQEGRLEPDPETVRHLDLCLDCRACESVCPAGVRYGEIYESAKAELLNRVGRPSALRRLGNAALRFLFATPGRMDLLADALRLYQRSGLPKLVRSRALSRILPASVREGEALLPDVASRAERALPPRTSPPAGVATKGRVAFFPTCVLPSLFPETNRASVALLAAAGYEVEIPEGMGCCGALHVHQGLRKEARSLAWRNVGAIDPGRYEAIVTASAGCGAALREYGHLLEVGAAPVGTDPFRARALSAKVRDVTELLAGAPLPLAPLSSAVAVHDPCHLAHAQKVRTAPRDLLRAVPSLEVRDLIHSDWCCGSAGVYNLLHPEMADRLLEQKIETIRIAGAAYVAVANPGCLLQIRKGLARAGLSTKALHPVEIAAMAVAPTPPNR
jgi:glycolate oxidase iron-sulfur subunit